MSIASFLLLYLVGTTPLERNSACGKVLTARDAIQVPGPGREAALAAAGAGEST